MFFFWFETKPASPFVDTVKSSHFTANDISQIVLASWCKWQAENKSTCILDKYLILDSNHVLFCITHPHTSLNEISISIDFSTKQCYMLHTTNYLPLAEQIRSDLTKHFEWSLFQIRKQNYIHMGVDISDYRISMTCPPRDSTSSLPVTKKATVPLQEPKISQTVRFVWCQWSHPHPSNYTFCQTHIQTELNNSIRYYFKNSITNLVVIAILVDIKNNSLYMIYTPNYQNLALHMKSGIVDVFHQLKAPSNIFVEMETITSTCPQFSKVECIHIIP